MAHIKFRKLKKKFNFNKITILNTLEYCLKSYYLIFIIKIKKFINFNKKFNQLKKEIFRILIIFNLNYFLNKSFIQLIYYNF